MLKKIGLGLLVVAALASFWIMNARAASGPVMGTLPDVTCPSGASTIAVPAATPSAGNMTANQLCVTVQNTGTVNPIRVGDSNITASRGLVLNPAPAANQGGGSVALCVKGAVYCWGAGGSSTMAIGSINAQ